MDVNLYHCFHDQYQEDIPFWLAIANQYGSPILELGCGTGRVLLALIQHGNHVIGLDKDYHMLAFLKQQIPPITNLHYKLVQADMTRFHFGINFKAIFIPCNTLSTLSITQMLKTFYCSISHLETGGSLIASIPNPAILAGLPETGESEIEGSFPHPQDGEPVQVSSSWVSAHGEVTFFWHYDHLLSNGRVHRNTFHSTHYPVPASNYEPWLRKAGFKDIQLYGDFNWTNFREDSPNLIIIATK